MIEIFKEWGIALLALILVLFLCYVVPRLVFTALFRSYYETKNLFKKEEDKNETSKSGQ